ncbi:MAG: dihydrofolate reductase [Pedobacter sp.]|nr:MAG: dihydrofolate reductase [Pedobacter sp.]
MRKLIFGINITLDGCCDHMKAKGYEDVHEYFGELMTEVDTLVYGRKTYDLMVPFWPDIARNHVGPETSMSKFAKAFDKIEKIVVFSQTMGPVDNSKTLVLNGDLNDEILRLKKEDGGDMLLGGVDVPSQLITLDLIDEYCFVVQPILAGEGRRLLDGINPFEQLELNLVSSRIFSSGCVALRYIK